jgi:hypothetical protein
MVFDLICSFGKLVESPMKRFISENLFRIDPLLINFRWEYKGEEGSCLVACCLVNFCISLNYLRNLLSKRLAMIVGSH